MQKRVIVLGSGLVGSAIAVDLADKYEVTAVDAQKTKLQGLQGKAGIRTIQADLSDPKTLGRLVADQDLVIGSLPGPLGYQSVRHTIEAGKDMVDISFFSEDPFGLDDLARKKEVTVVTDMGVAPGMSNLILGYHHEQMQVNTFECYVGGLPVKREWPWEYKAVFSPIDVIEEYTRPARYMQNGSLVVREALSDAELIEFDEAGTLEAWNSDGLRTLLTTVEVPNMIEKTLRYPGTIEYLKVLRDTGFFKTHAVEVGGQKIRPIDLTSKLMFPKWKLKPGEEEFTAMRIRIEGVEAGHKVCHRYDLFDSYDRQTHTTSMARTTGYACTAMANIILEENYRNHGINPPEYVGKKEDLFDFIMKYMMERNVVYKHSVQ